jgi:hypothetical protein
LFDAVLIDVTPMQTVAVSGGVATVGAGVPGQVHRWTR